MVPNKSIIIYVITLISLTEIIAMPYPISEPILCPAIACESGKDRICCPKPSCECCICKNSTQVPTIIVDPPPFVCLFVCPPNTSYNCCPNPKPLCGCCSCNPMPVYCKCKERPLCCKGPPNPEECHCGCDHSKECINSRPPYHTQMHGMPPLPVLCLCVEFNGTKPCCTKPPIPGECQCDCVYTKKCNNMYLTAEPPYKPGKPNIICDCTLIDPPQGPPPCCTYKPGVCECGCQQCNNYPWQGWNGWHRNEKNQQLTKKD